MSLGKIALLMCLLLMVSFSISGQDDDTQPNPPTATPDVNANLDVLRYGQTVSGRIDNRTPRQRYAIEGLRGEYLSVDFRLLDGGLDAVLAIVDDRGELVLLRNIIGADAQPNIDPFQLQSNGRYLLTVGRFADRYGTTAGDYSLTINRIGVSPESGSALRYGDTIANTISEDDPQLFYSFRGQRGDIITLTMRRDSGDLDPVLQIVSADRRILAENDDMEGSTNARIERFVVEDDGQYLIIATRYAGTGDFLLTLDIADDSGIGRTPEVAIPLAADRPDERSLDDETYQLYYTFNAGRNDVVTVRMQRLSGSLDPLIEILNAGLQPLITNDDIEEGVLRDSEIAAYRIPADGTYYILATRFERAIGQTSGDYRLTLINRGSAFTEVSEEAQLLEFGATASGYLDDENPEDLYAFYGTEGQVIRSAMNRGEGDFLPRITVLDENRNLLIGSEIGSLNALISAYELPATGIYYLRAEREAGNTSGAYILFLAQVTP